MEAIDTARVVTRLAEAFRTSIGEGELTIWHEQLVSARVTPEAADVACDDWIGTELFFPKITEFIRTAHAVARRMASERPSGWAGRAGDGTAACPECGDTQFVEVGDEADFGEARTLRPCSCHPGYGEWSAGRWGPSDREYRPLPPLADGSRRRR